MCFWYKYEKASNTDFRDSVFWCIFRKKNFFWFFQNLKLKLAEYTADKNEFLLVRVEEKGKTEHNNTVVCVLSEYEPQNNRIYAKLLLMQHQQQQTANTCSPQPKSTTKEDPNSTTPAQEPTPHKENQLSVKENTTDNMKASSSTLCPAPAASSSQETPKINQVVLTYDDLKTTFDIFLQVLLSQYLNAEFMLRIKQMQDEYFKPSIDFVDGILNEKLELCQNYLNEFVAYLHGQQPGVFLKLNPHLFDKWLALKPELLLSTILPGHIKCQSFLYAHCSVEFNASLDETLKANCSVNFTGKAYNAETLLECSEEEINNALLGLDEPSLSNEAGKQESGHFYVCSKMFNFIRVMHSIKHFKISLYHLSCKKVDDSFVF